MTTTESTQDVRSELVAIVAPLRTKVADLDRRISAAEAALAEMRDARRDAQKALILLDPSATPESLKKQREKINANYHNGNYGVSTETLDKVKAWLTENAERVNGDGFSGPSLMVSGYDVTSRATLTNALHALHDHEFIRLDHRSKGGGKVYKLAAH